MMKKFKRIYVEITNACNLNCHFCDKTIRPKRHMTSSEYRLVIDKIAPFTDYVYLHVKGEPLLHNELEEILEISKGKVLVNITTNGTLIDKRIDVLRKYKAVINRVNISVHSNFQDEGYLEKVQSLFPNSYCFYVSDYTKIGNIRKILENFFRGSKKVGLGCAYLCSVKKKTSSQDEVMKKLFFCVGQRFW